MTKPKPWLGIMFECCSVYRRIYINKDQNAYEGQCPKCCGKIKVIISPDGTTRRIFSAW